MTGVEGRAMMVHCIAGGHPIPTLTWLKNLSPLVMEEGMDARIRVGAVVVNELVCFLVDIFKGLSVYVIVF